MTKIIKTPMNSAPMELLEVFSKMCQVGLKKGYPENSWLTSVTINEHLEALKRHIRDYEKGIDIDVDGFHNLEAILWRGSAACLVNYFQTQPTNKRWLAEIVTKPKSNPQKHPYLRLDDFFDDSQW